ncbi:cytochrome c oxidase subunit 3 [Flammeovirga yaeyamensis]|uniref:Cytochrome c oxidase subunit 3 n=1 Tax=Flammeovirga yaeyamensis TaxID=367791 RepID=A0AAX1N9F5_9BACT|nr:cytochrome c oxidase subunit 3 [Flammeovirga yaeyamensis]MBB3698739.1 cytochrome c oxidase subunit 3 [Flammeovirga yaeyamensis]NMF37325.1 cytochrome oxidase subunit III [Flammeovirga yaeyamensis]QWG03857.1 cytochrome c oxidase subunit 3 [Flammeovirga yaeyamensis]
MKTDISVSNTPNQPVKIHPKKFAMWLFIVSVMMIFAALISAYIVRQAEGNWVLFDLPNIMYVSTAVILLSSATMHWAYTNTKVDNLKNLKIGISLTALLGSAFLVLQFLGWSHLVDMEIFFGGKDSNPSGSFVYVFTGLHGLHIVSAVIYLFVILIESFRGKIHKGTIVRMEMCATYWHFLDALWVCILIFLLLYR